VVRNKKPLTLTQLEDHVSYWAVNQIEMLADTAEMINFDSSVPEDEKAFALSAIAEQFKELLDLLMAVPHEDDECLIEWTQTFIRKNLLKQTKSKPSG